MVAETPQEIYNFAMQERKSDNQLERRDGCEKGYLSVTTALDAYFKSKGIMIPQDGTASGERSDAFRELMKREPQNMLFYDNLRGVFDKIQTELHLQCFYYGRGADSPDPDRIMKKEVRGLLETLGFGFITED